MMAHNLLSCATAGILTLASLHAAPQFRSLTPGNQAAPTSSTWVRHLNGMDEAERQRRVHTFGMPPAPPNRWANRVRARPVLQQPKPPVRSVPVAARSAPVAVRSAPVSLYQHRPPVSPSKVQPAARAQAVRYAPPKRQPQPIRKEKPVRQKKPDKKAKPVQVIPSPQTSRPVVYTPPAPKVQPVKQTQPPKRLRLLPWKPSVLKSKPEPVSREETLRQQVAFMPTNSTRIPQANPYAPYGSRDEYDQAIRRSKWQPRARSAKILADQRKRPSPVPQAKPKKRWTIGSIFRRKKAAPGAKTQERSSNTKQRVPNSTYVTAGLPQSRSDSGSMIETTLLGN